MPYEFTEDSGEPEPQPSPSRAGQPPRKGIGIGLLDPPSARSGGSSYSHKLPRVSFLGGVLILLACLAALFAVGLLSR